MIRLARPDIREKEIRSVLQVLRSGFIGQGRRVQEFERLVSGYVGTKHAVAVSSGTSALHLSCLALEIGPGDEVIVPDFTFPAAANVVKLAGAKPVPVDIDLNTFNIDANAIRSAITPRTKAILPVHLFGQTADMKPILKIAQAHKLFVIEDAACALGAEYEKRKCGSLGIVGCFSFHPRKIITTGEGGMVVTDHYRIAERIRQLRNHGIRTTRGGNRLGLAGLNYRMTDFQAALGISQMKRIESIIEKRGRIAKGYEQQLSECESIRLPRPASGIRHVWQSYIILIQKKGAQRDRVLKQLRQRGIEATLGTYSLSAQPLYAEFKGRFPNSSYAYRESVSLPLHTRLAPSDIKEVARCLKRAL